MLSAQVRNGKLLEQVRRTERIIWPTGLQSELMPRAWAWRLAHHQDQPEAPVAKQ
jgi:hypothetical protein